MTFGEKLSVVLMVQWEGIRVWADPPRRLNLTVDHDWEKRQAQERKNFKQRYGNLHDAMFLKPDTYKLPPMKCIHVTHVYREDGKERKLDGTIAIDLERRRIDYRYSTGWLFGKEHRGSGMLGVLLLSLPITIPLSPLLFAANQYYCAIERRQGMSRHSCALLKTISKQIDVETHGLLVEVFQNSWQFEQAMSRQVDIAAARELLATCELREESVEARDGTNAARSFHWFDGKEDLVANGSFYGRRDHYVRVLGSTFEDSDADILIEVYKTRKLVEHKLED